MLPHYHLIYGTILAILLLLFPGITYIEAIIVLLSSFLIDIDHYISYIIIKKDLSLKKAYFWERYENKAKGKLNILHTIEVLVILGILSIYIKYIFFIFIGFIFHFILDLLGLIKRKKLYNREFFIIHYFIKKNARAGI
jgi:hypothetical protein